MAKKRTAFQAQLASLSELSANRIRDLKYGTVLTAQTGYTIAELIEKVALDRVALGALLHREARAAMERSPPSFRNSISRSYYSMYQTFRGVVFYVTQGDDYEKHSILAQHIPDDFPGSPYWENALKTARLERNKADYEPYPRNDSQFEVQARAIYADSYRLRSAALTYLRSKGLRI